MAKHEQQAYERLGAKVLTLPDVIAQSVGFMGPVFVRAAGHPALLLAVRLGVHVRRVRAGGGVPADGGRVAARLRVRTRSPGRVRLVVSAVIAIAITAGAIFGSFYKVTSPTIYAPWILLAVLVIGFASTFVTRARRSASSELSDLTKSTA